MQRFLRKIRQIINTLLGRKSNVDNFLAGGGILGKNCVIFPDVFFGSEPYLITIGDNVRITYGVKFATHDGGMWTLRKTGRLENSDVFGRIRIGDNTNIGWNAIILPGVTIEKNCVIGAGAVVTKDIPDNSVAAGVPARVIETLEAYAQKAELRCDYTKSMTSAEKKKYLLKKYNLE